MLDTMSASRFTETVVGLALKTGEPIPSGSNEGKHALRWVGGGGISFYAGHRLHKRKQTW